MGMKKKADKKYYVVLRGRKRGVFDSWELCEDQIMYFRKSLFKKVESLEKAAIYIMQNIIMDESPYFININGQETMYEDYILFMDTLEGMAIWDGTGTGK